MRIFGKFNTFISKRKKEIAENGYDEIKDVVLGNDLSMIMEDQFAMLVDDDLENLFYLDYVNEELLDFIIETKKLKLSNQE